MYCSATKVHHCTLRRDVDKGAPDEDNVVVDVVLLAVEEAVEVDVLVEVVVFMESNMSSHRFNNCNTMAL